MVKVLRSGGKFWRGLVVEGLAILAVVLLVTSGRINSIETRSAESSSAESSSAESSSVRSASSPAAQRISSGADDPEFTASDDAVERQLRRASTRLQQLLTRHWQRVESDLRRDLEVVKK